MKNIFATILVFTTNFSLCAQEEYQAFRFKLNRPDTDSYLYSQSNYGQYHLIGTYPGWDKDGIYIAGYNSTNRPNIRTKKVYIGHSICFDIEKNNLALYSLNLNAQNNDGIRIGRNKDKLGWNGEGDQPGYHIRFTGYRDVAGNVTGARISALRTNLCCSGKYQGMDLAFYVTNSIQEKSSGDVNLKEAMRIRDNGNVGIGTTTPKAKLDVAGTIRATEIKVEAQTADFVFEDNYPLRTLDEVEAFIKENGHLPDFCSAKEMKSSGVNLAEMNKLLLQKIEELTLYAISIEKQNKELKSEQRKGIGERKKLEEDIQNLDDELKAIKEIIRNFNSK